MALFGLKKDEVKKNTQPVLVSGNSSKTSQNRDLSNVLIKPRTTEKSTGQNDRGVYTFVVRRDATKYDVRDAVTLLFKVTPRKVTIVNRVPRTSHARAKGRKVVVPGMKKASVFLKKGDRLDLV